MTSLLSDLLTRRPVAATVSRRELRFVALKLPSLKGKVLLNAVKLQLQPYYPAGSRQAFVFKSFADGQTQVWLWSPAPDISVGELRQTWPVTLLEQPGHGLRLLARNTGFEAQYWAQEQLRQTRWWPQEPGTQDWSLFVRACGLDPDAHPRPSAQAPRPAKAPERNWLRGDNLPSADAWEGWRWQAAVVLAGCAVAVGAGIHVQTVQQLREDQALLDQLRKNREVALAQRSRYLEMRADYDALSALAPRISQLELVQRVISSGILAVPAAGPARTAEASVGNTVSALTPGAAALAPPPAPSLAEWDYRNEQLKLGMDIPEGQLVMLDITRRIEKLPGFANVRIGLESTNTSLILNMRVAEANESPAAP